MNFQKCAAAFSILYGLSLSSKAEAKELSSVAVSQKLKLTQKLTGNEGLKLVVINCHTVHSFLDNVHRCQQMSNTTNNSAPAENVDTRLA